jgi:hypothetical protein
LLFLPVDVGIKDDGRSEEVKREEGSDEVA